MSICQRKKPTPGSQKRFFSLKELKNVMGAAIQNISESTTPTWGYEKQQIIKILNKIVEDLANMKKEERSRKWL